MSVKVQPGSKGFIESVPFFHPSLMVEIDIQVPFTIANSIDSISNSLILVEVSKATHKLGILAVLTGRKRLRQVDSIILRLSLNLYPDPKISVSFYTPPTRASTGSIEYYESGYKHFMCWNSITKLNFDRLVYLCLN